MSFLEFPIRRYQFTLVAFALLVALGITSVHGHSAPGKQLYFPIAAFSITAVYPGADPEDVERLVVEPIEDALAELDDVRRSTSTATTARADRDRVLLLGPDNKYDEVIREVNVVRPTLPPEVCARRAQVQARAGQHRAVRAGLPNA